MRSIYGEKRGAHEISGRSMLRLLTDSSARGSDGTSSRFREMLMPAQRHDMSPLEITSY